MRIFDENEFKKLHMVLFVFKLPSDYIKHSENWMW